MPDGSTSILRPRADPMPALRQLLLGDEAYATTLLVACVDRWGTECLSWAPMTLRMELEEACGIRLPKTSFDRLMAGVTILTTDLFFQDVARFIQLCNVLAGDDFQPDEFDPADSAECAWGVTEALLLVPPDEETPEPFSDDVRRYIGFVLRQEGFVTPPDILRIALDADFADQVRYDWSDDPEMFQAMHEMQQDKAKEVEFLIRSGLTELLGQLQALPLLHGDTTDLQKRIGATVRASVKEYQE